MSPLAPKQALQLAIQYHQTGRLAEAEALYRQVLAQQPNNADALHLLGLLAQEAGHADKAVDLIRKAIAVRPAAVFFVNLGNILQGLQQYDQALDAHRQALNLDANLPEAHFGLGNALRSVGQLKEAIEAFRRAIALRSQFAAAHGNLGHALFAKGDLNGAAAAYRQAAALMPHDADLQYRIGLCLYREGKVHESIESFARAISIHPNNATYLNELGNAHYDLRDYANAERLYRQILTVAPRSSLAHYNLGNVLARLGRLDEAVESYRRAMELDPSSADTANNLGIALKNLGRVSESLDCYSRAMEKHPDRIDLHSNYVYDLHFHPDYDAKALLAEHRKWHQRHTAPLARFIQPHHNDRSPDRRLRIGYVSPDFNDHVVGNNVYPPLSRHDHQQFEIFCYSASRHTDAMTTELRRHADHWREIHSLSDEAAAEMIRADQIDVLVDLTLHMAGNRLQLFGRKPAPIQVTYLGYCSTTGVDTIDYRISDPYMDPQDTDLSVYTEQTVRLPTSYWCYLPGGPAPEVNPLPALTNGFITFGCLNNFAKVSPPAQQTWAMLMARIPRSRLVLHCEGESARDVVRERFARHEVSADRLEFVGKRAWPRYLQSLQRIDIALDPFPYGGGITTCDSLWMGVPVISLSGQTAVGRGGRSILNNVGLPDWVAGSGEEYVNLAVQRANDLQGLSELRSTLRPRMQSSPLMDANRFAREVEAAYRQMWQHHTTGPP